MEHGKGRFGVWVALCCAVPLVALAAVLLFDAPMLLTTLVAFLALALIAPRLFASTPAGSESPSSGESEPGTPARQP